jgi:hypothetical protein
MLNSKKEGGRVVGGSGSRWRCVAVAIDGGAWRWQSMAVGDDEWWWWVVVAVGGGKLRATPIKSVMVLTGLPLGQTCQLVTC